MKNRNAILLFVIVIIGTAIVFVFSSGKENSSNGTLVGVVTLLSFLLYAALKSKKLK